MNTLLIKLAGAACVLASYALFGSSAYALSCWKCDKHENSSTLQQPAHANTCTDPNNCNECKYYFTPEYGCKIVLFNDCTVTHGATVAATVYAVGCLAGSSCRCPGTGGSPQAATIAVTGDTCTP